MSTKDCFLPASSSSIPEKWRDFSYETKWHILLTRILYGPMLENLQVYPKDGTDGDRAWNILFTAANQSTLDLEYKTTVLPYLMDQWFLDWSARA